MENLAREYKSPVIGWPPQELVGEGQSPCLSETVTAMKEHRETNSGGGHEKCITTMYFRAHEYAEVINAGRPRIDLSFAEDLPIVRWNNAAMEDYLHSRWPSDCRGHPEFLRGIDQEVWAGNICLTHRSRSLLQ